MGLTFRSLQQLEALQKRMGALSRLVGKIVAEHEDCAGCPLCRTAGGLEFLLDNFLVPHLDADRSEITIKLERGDDDYDEDDDDHDSADWWKKPGGQPGLN